MPDAAGERPAARLAEARSVGSRPTQLKLGIAEIYTE